MWQQEKRDIEMGGRLWAGTAPLTEYGKVVLLILLVLAPGAAGLLYYFCGKGG